MWPYLYLGITKSGVKGRLRSGDREVGTRVKGNDKSPGKNAKDLLVSITQTNWGHRTS